MELPQISTSFWKHILSENIWGRLWSLSLLLWQNKAQRPWHSSQLRRMHQSQRATRHRRKGGMPRRRPTSKKPASGRPFGAIAGCRQKKPKDTKTNPQAPVLAHKTQRSPNKSETTSCRTQIAALAVEDPRRYGRHAHNCSYFNSHIMSETPRSKSTNDIWGRFLARINLSTVFFLCLRKRVLWECVQLVWTVLAWKPVINPKLSPIICRLESFTWAHPIIFHTFSYSISSCSIVQAALQWNGRRAVIPSCYTKRPAELDWFHWFHWCPITLIQQNTPVGHAYTNDRNGTYIWCVQFQHRLCETSIYCPTVQPVTLIDSSSDES